MARYECKHGELVSQCRCPCKDKPVIVDCPSTCQKKEEKDTNATQS